MSSSSNSQKFQVNWFDPLGWLLFRKLRFNVVGIVILQLALATFEILVLYSRYSNYTLQLSHYIFVYVIIPIFWVYYTTTQDRIPRLFRKMPENQIFEDESIDDYWEYTKDVRKSFNSRYWSILASLSGIVIIIINVSITWEQLQVPYRSSLEHATFVVIWFFLTCYILSLTVIREIVNVVWLSRLFRKIPIRVQLMHPDRAGGFRFIGQYFSLLTYLVIAIGYGLTIDFFIMPLINGEPIYLGPEVIFAWMLYFILVPTSFIMPLWSIHQAMKQKKATVLKNISDQFNNGVKETLSSLSGDEATISKNLEKTKELQKIYSLIEDQYPTWPLSLHQRRNISISALIPIITSIGSLVIEYLL